MKYEEIIAITGRPGLYHILSNTRTGVVALSLTDGKRVTTKPTEKVSVLGDIQIYTYSGEKPLMDIFAQIAKIEKDGNAPLSPRASKEELHQYFSEILPDYDVERVYPNHIKKVVQWYQLLKTHNLLPVTKTKKQTKDQ